MNIIPALTFAIMALVCIFCLIIPDEKEFETPEDKRKNNETVN